jgi:hypothetical protein
VSRSIVLVLAAVLAIGCGSNLRNAFGYHFLDNQEADLGAVLGALPEPSRDDAPENALGAPIAVAATHVENDGTRQIIAWRVDTGDQMWTAEIDAQTRPEILGDVVLTSRRQEIVAFDLQSGRQLYTVPLADIAYVGATRDGDTIYYAATVGALGGARRVGHVAAIDARSGGEVWRHEVIGVFGEPAAAGGMVFVPWERQNIAVLEGATGDELARLRSTDDVISWAFDHPTGVYYGSRGIYRLTQRSTNGTRAEATHLAVPMQNLPRQPEFVWEDGFLPKTGTRTARGKIRVYFNPSPPPTSSTSGSRATLSTSSSTATSSPTAWRASFAGRGCSSRT